MSDCGYLEIILGPMFSGKTTHLVSQYKKFTYIGKKVCVINYSEDKRYHETMLSTHDKIMIPCIFSERLGDIREVDDADVIIINEGQFFEDLFEVVIDLVEKKHKSVYVCGLDGDFKRNKFGKILDLIPYCDKVMKLNSLCSQCRDGTMGVFSHRISKETSQVVIGSDNYQPLCRKCYQSHLF
jgi:thymidine kinase